MALKFKPHSVLVKQASDDVDSDNKEVAAPKYSAGVTIECQITPQNAGAVFQKIGVETTRPHQLLCDQEDVQYFKPGNRVVWSGRTFYVQHVENFVVSLFCDHGSVIIAENQHQP